MGDWAVIAPEDVVASIGKEVGVSPWREVTQQMINLFADATDDHQFIHVDPERAAAETPYGGTIAHGFLLVSLLSAMAFETLPRIEGMSLSLNQGFDKLRFQVPVKSGARIRTRFILADATVRPSGMVQLVYEITLEIEGMVKPALTARWLTIAMRDRREDG